MKENYESLFTTREAAQYLGLAKITLDIWRSKGLPPAYVKIHRSVRYRREDLDAFIMSRRVEAEQ
jgi:excisionase family DNA binding protein